MSSFYWIKLFHEVIDDAKMALLPDRLWRRVIELFLLAGRHNRQGRLPGTDELAWELRLPALDLQSDLDQLTHTGIITRLNDGWLVTNFDKRQAPSSPAERKRQQRLCHVPVTQMSQLVTQNREDTDTESEAEVESKQPAPASSDLLIYYPENPAEAAGNGWIKLVMGITGAFPPQAEYKNIIDTLIMLGRSYPGIPELETYLQPFFDAWKNRKNKNGSSYSLSNFAWLYDWAVNGSVPPENRKDSSSQDREKLSRQQSALYSSRVNP